jgi:hypothetical protein
MRRARSLPCRWAAPTAARRCDAGIPLATPRRLGLPVMMSGGLSSADRPEHARLAAREANITSTCTRGRWLHVARGGAALRHESAEWPPASPSRRHPTLAACLSAAMAALPKSQEGSIPGIEGLTGVARQEAVVEEVRRPSRGAARGPSSAVAGQGGTLVVQHQSHRGQRIVAGPPASSPGHRGAHIGARPSAPPSAGLW